MAEPPPATMTITVDLPILVNIFQSVRNLEAGNQNLQTEIRDLRTDFTTRLEALEAQLAFQPPIQSLAGVNPNLSQELPDDTTHAHGNLGTQGEGHVDEAREVQIDDGFHEDVRTQEDDVQGNDLAREEENNLGDVAATAHVNDPAHKHEEDFHEEDEPEATNIIGSSPSIDRGITVIPKPMISQPAASKKRKRTVGDTQAMGFLIRDSDVQLAQKRLEDVEGPSRSESPFDRNDRRDQSSDEVIPATAPQAAPALSRSSARPRPRETKKAKEAGLDEFVAPKPGALDRSRRTGRIRTKTKQPPGIVATPQFE